MKNIVNNFVTSVNFRRKTNKNAFSQSSSPMSDTVADYVDALKRDLTFNSKPHINNLTTIAKENVSYCTEIVAAVEQRIRTVSNYSLIMSNNVTDILLLGPTIRKVTFTILVRLYCQEYWWSIHCTVLQINSRDILHCI
jgi:hypothetical protein